MDYVCRLLQLNITLDTGEIHENENYDRVCTDCCTWFWGTALARSQGDVTKDLSKAAKTTVSAYKKYGMSGLISLAQDCYAKQQNTYMDSSRFASISSLLVLGYDCTRISGRSVERICSGHDGLFARLRLIALSCPEAQRIRQVL
jgi:hypothetical protein